MGSSLDDLKLKRHFPSETTYTFSFYGHRNLEYLHNSHYDLELKIIFVILMIFAQWLNTMLCFLLLLMIVNFVITIWHIFILDHFRLFSGNWDQYVECLFIKETNAIQILIEIPPNDFKMTLFDVSIFDDFQLDIANININSSMYSVHQDQLHLFTNGYISTVSS